MLMPKRVKWRKQMRGRMRGKALRGAEISFGEYGLQALEPGWVTARQIEAANALLQTPCETACADAGYADTAELEKIDSQGIAVIVPSKRQALKKPEGPFSKSHFTYDRKQDVYLCPEGHRLRSDGTAKNTGKRHYVITDAAINIAPIAVTSIGQPLSEGKKATASNVYQKQVSNYGPQAAFDGDSETRWATDSGTKQAWIVADLGTL